ncbi:helix-turn-helix domain-containing protein, partial [Flavobacterium cupreum]|uniref:helix-turn-helix domain-containing protein n=1 Tax=Flavobacterium cupreum TaxID=2133766 RepID=UPI001EDD6F7D
KNIVFNQNGGAHFAPELGGHFELESGAHFKTEWGDQYNRNLHSIGEIAERFQISEGSVYNHIRKYSIPTRQIGKYVYAPKMEIDNLYNGNDFI